MVMCRNYPCPSLISRIILTLPSPSPARLSPFPASLLVCKNSALPRSLPRSLVAAHAHLLISDISPLFHQEVPLSVSLCVPLFHMEQTSHRFSLSSVPDMEQLLFRTSLSLIRSQGRRRRKEQKGLNKEGGRERGESRKGEESSSSSREQSMDKGENPRGICHTQPRKPDQKTPHLNVCVSGRVRASV